MKIAVASDSHDNLPMIAAAVAAFKERGAELLIHAGDFVAPFAVKKWLTVGVPMLAVFGNCDGERKVVAELLPDVVDGTRRETLGGRRFVIVHSLESLGAGVRSGADVIICGHTHKPDISGARPLVINPGECGGWLTDRATVAWLDTDTMKPELIELAKQ